MYDTHPPLRGHRGRHPPPDRPTAGRSTRARRSSWLLFAVAVSAAAAGLLTGHGLLLGAGLMLASAGVHLVSGAPGAPAVRDRPRSAGAAHDHEIDVAVVDRQRRVGHSVLAGAPAAVGGEGDGVAGHG